MKHELQPVIHENHIGFSLALFELRKNMSLDLFSPGVSCLKFSMRYEKFKICKQFECSLQLVRKSTQWKVINFVIILSEKMGERKGTNLYYPPDYDPRMGGLNKFMGTHALRERARKLHMGILIIRFEMPFNIWCNGCNNHIGMGVRYNAEKKKIGMYYSTPLYMFRMKCHLCDNHFEIKTDPANLTYIVETGARRQENRWDPTENEQIVPEEKEVSKRLYDDPMFKLEHSMDDKKKAKSQDTTLNAIIANNEQFFILKLEFKN
ncbi:Similar to CG15084: Coiled-coil domain-containing protein 130 homolog (Drosophila melanogaster) [Cotesia congregata]|uniref:Similar to CG15084: Coiled-coil domain-containing protein 130 homolog (Drosophila melanogaster) n=1 Tax=Cotesia congregata TaxID=51543 RepID=A0A8J2H529_COTCN|nr:Similar to CG15084: Coiled-coil domain-containing protein 130 homolog (Drosophila melanogaster) [Cotesia congregata]